MSSSAEGTGEGGDKSIRTDEVVIEMTTPSGVLNLSTVSEGGSVPAKAKEGAAPAAGGLPARDPSFPAPIRSSRRGSVRRRTSQEERERIGELVRRRSSQGSLLGTPGFSDDVFLNPMSAKHATAPSTLLAAKLGTPRTQQTFNSANSMHGRVGFGGGGRKGKQAKKPPSYPDNWPYSTDEEVKKRSRLVFMNEEQDYSFSSNLIITSKYTLLSFLPLFLFASFNPKKKMANVYFLLLAIFQCVPAISNTLGIPTVLLPLSIVIIIDGVFAALEDIRRHKADQAANSSPTKIWDYETQSFQDKTWVNIQVGDFIMIENYGVVPADVVLIAVHEPNAEQPDGICYLETKSLDGETNLKIRQTVQATLGRIKEPNDLAPFKGLVEMEHPNKMIDSFEGTIEIYNDTTRVLRKEVIQHVNVLLRGCVVRNTKWVLGLVLNTGRDTKIMMSSIDPPPKSSVMTLAINVEIRRIVLLLVGVCVIGATGFVVMARLYNDQFGYLQYPSAVLSGDMDSALGDWIIQFAYLMLLLGNFIPVSLYVSMSTIRFFQAIFMEWDLRMYHQPVDQHCEVRTMNLNEELGQVSHVFTDKTGTLTCNIMEFRKCSINGYSYGLGVTEISKSYRRMSGMTFSPDELRIEAESRKTSVPHVNFYDPIFWDDLNKGRRGEGQRRKIEDFFRLLAVCHSVTPEKDEKTHEIKFSASSPDDEALVCAAKFFGFRFEGRREGAAQVRTNYGVENFKVLEVLEFTSARKRMSVIVETDDGKVMVLAKGADTAMIARLRKGQEALVESTMDHMKRFATEGLRTLMICQATITLEHFARWYHKFERASKDLEQISRRKRGEANEIERLMDEIEKDLELVGATAIEDKLQEGVPETIFDLSRAGIKVWMLTGDKEETATNIGVACNLLEHHSTMRRITINTEKCQNEAQIRYVLKEELKKYKEDWEKHGDRTKPRALIIDGASLIAASGDKVLRRLVKLTRICKAVVACRVSPDQKRSIVQMVTSNDPRVRALSIGDGANDVPMIQKAHIGVGIAGQEGMQAVNASDYAICQFRFLSPLLLAHGRWNYRRMAYVVTYIFYKNILEAVSMFFFAFCNAFSGQKLFTEGSIQLYNVLFTTAPLLLYGMWDRDVSYDHVLKYPQLYIPGIRGESFTFDTFWRWILIALVEAVWATIFPVYALQTVTVNNSFSSSFWEAGAVTFTCIILIVNLKIAVRQERWTAYNVVIWLLTVLLWFGAGMAISSLFLVDKNWYMLFHHVMTSPGCWLVIIIVTVVLHLADVLVMGYKRAFHPELVHVIQAMETGIRSEVDMHKAIQDMQINELKSISQGVPAVSPANATPIEAAMRTMLLEGTMRARRTAGFAFSADPITLEAERRRIMYNTARMGVLREILEELEFGDESEFPDEFDRPALDPDESHTIAKQPSSDAGLDSSGPSPVVDPAQSLRNGGSTRSAAIRLLEAASVRFQSPLNLTGDAATLQSSQPQAQAQTEAQAEAQAVLSPDDSPSPSSEQDAATSPPVLPHADSTGHLV